LLVDETNFLKGASGLPVSKMDKLTILDADNPLALFSIAFKFLLRVIEIKNL